jgi:hypothetical protein
LTAADADSLIIDFEAVRARSLGHDGRRGAGVFYTPPEVAAHVVALAQEHGGSGVVLDPCAGAGAFLLAAARAGFKQLRGIDLDREALLVARKALKAAGAKASLVCGDALLVKPRGIVDCVISNPPYGHVPADEKLLRDFPALRGGEVDRYALFILRSLQLVRPGGVVALLVPDTWMFLARAGSLREEVLRLSEVAAAVDLGKPFAAAKDTRVQALVLVRKPAKSRETAVARGRMQLSPAPREELQANARRGWFLYRSVAERALCAAMEAASVPLGEACSVGYGMRTGNNPRYVARRAPSPAEIGLCGGEDVTPFVLRLKPKTLLHAEELGALVERQRGRPRLAVQRIRTNAQTPWARWLEAAPVSPDLICLDSLSTLACDSADRLWALLALVQSVALQRYHRLRTTDVNVKPGALRELPVPRGILTAPLELATLARARAAGGDLDRAIDACVYRLYELPDGLVEACERGFWEERFPEENQRLNRFMSDPPASVARKEEIA